MSEHLESPLTRAITAKRLEALAQPALQVLALMRQTDPKEIQFSVNDHVSRVLMPISVDGKLVAHVRLALSDLKTANQNQKHEILKNYLDWVQTVTEGHLQNAVRVQLEFPTELDKMWQVIAE